MCHVERDDHSSRPPAPAIAELEPLLGETRAAWGPQVLANLEKLVYATPNGGERVAAIRERLKAIPPGLAKRQSPPASKG